MDWSHRITIVDVVASMIIIIVIEGASLFAVVQGKDAALFVVVEGEVKDRSYLVKVRVEFLPLSPVQL
jgi:hypothetical protein